VVPKFDGILSSDRNSGHEDVDCFADQYTPTKGGEKTTHAKYFYKERNGRKLLPKVLIEARI
jgi:hypothetical protein